MAVQGKASARPSGSPRATWCAGRTSGTSSTRRSMLCLCVRRLLVNWPCAEYEKREGRLRGPLSGMLLAGGNKHHKELLAQLGLDVTDPGFWALGIGVVERLIDELEQ